MWLHHWNSVHLTSIDRLIWMYIVLITVFTEILCYLYCTWPMYHLLKINLFYELHSVTYYTFPYIALLQRSLKYENIDRTLSSSCTFRGQTFLQCFVFAVSSLLIDRLQCYALLHNKYNDLRWQISVSFCNI